MKVRYRANGRVAEVSEAAAKQLIAARICEAVDEESDEPTCDTRLFTREAPLKTTSVTHGRRRR